MKTLLQLLGTAKQYFAKRQQQGRIKRLAQTWFAQHFPEDQICWTNIAEETTDHIIVGISYGAGRIPPPYRFLCISLADSSVTLMAKDYWPPTWGAYR